MTPRGNYSCGASVFVFYFGITYIVATAHHSISLNSR